MEKHILIALLIGAGGFWLFSSVPQPEATHILVYDTAVVADADGYVGTFTFENRGAADLLMGVESDEAAITLSTVPILVPEGVTALTLDGFHLRLTDVTVRGSVPVRLMFDVAGPVSANLTFR